MVNNWQDAIRHCIRVNNNCIERLTRWIAEIEGSKDIWDLVQLEMLKTKLREREISNEDLEGILEEYGKDE